MYFSTTIHVDDSATHRQTLMERGRADLIIWSSSSIDQSASHAFSLLKIFQCYYSIISRGLFAADKSQPNSHILWEWHVRWQCEDLSQLLHLLLLLISSNKMKILFSSFFGLCLGNLWLWCWEWWWQCASYLVGHKLLLGWVLVLLGWVTSYYWGGWPSTLNPSQRILLPLTIYTVTHFRTTFTPLLEWSFYSGPG